MKKCKCKGCYSDAICRDGRCAKHTNGKRAKQEYSRRSSPRSSTPHLGIEIECFAEMSGAHDAMLSQSIVPCSDGSLPAMGCEFKICRPAKMAIKKAVRLASRLNAAGAKVNKKCGLHVHLDCRGLTRERKVAFVRWMGNNQDWFLSLFPRSRQPGVCPHIERIQWPESTDHYVWCHITGYNTIEIRIHGGTLNRHKMLGWLNACKDLLDLLRSGVEFPAIEFEDGVAVVEPTEAEQNDPISPVRRPRRVRASRRKAAGTWISRVFRTPAAAEYITARQDNSGVLESFEEVASCAD